MPLIAANRSAANTQNKDNAAAMRDVVGLGLPLSMLRVPGVDIGGFRFAPSASLFIQLWNCIPDPD